VPGASALLAAPGYVLAFTRESPTAAVACLIVPTLLHYMYIGPTLGVMHNLVAPRMRATATALFLFVVNLIGLGAGPYVTGMLNDLFSARAFAAAGQAGASFGVDCPGGLAPPGAGEALVQACSAATVHGTRAGIVLVTLVLVWAAAHYFWSSRTLHRDLLAAQMI
jgi:hypothetical protein